MRHPSPIELMTERTQYRPPRIDKDGKADDPWVQSNYGKLTVALGTSAMAFAVMRLRRVKAEKLLIANMWKEHTSVRSLRMAAEAGEQLPPCVMLRGWLSARGAPVKSLAAQIPQLNDRMGQIDQPQNYFVGLAEKMKTGQIPTPPDVQEFIQDSEYIDHFSNQSREPGENLLVRELLVTRLGCEAVRQEKKDKNGERKVTITRRPRQARFNVFHDREVAEGLHVVGLTGETADLKLAPYRQEDLAAHESPSLFLSVPDALQEFKKWAPQWGVINADKAFTHMSRFLHLDQRSDTDSGSFSVGFSNQESALDTLGRLRPNGWLWNGKGFYDNNSRAEHWMSYYETQFVQYPEYAKHMAVAKEENSRYQRASEYSYDEMMRRRDEENCFRFAELGISASEVVVVGKPTYTDRSASSSKERRSSGRRGWRHRPTSSGITIGPPDEKSASEAQFEFRILRGHTAEQLLNHRQMSTNVFLGLAAMAALTIGAGEEMIRDAVVMVDVL